MGEAMSKASKSLASLVSDIAKDTSPVTGAMPNFPGHRRSRSIDDAIDTIGEQKKNTTVTIDPDIIDPAPHADRVALDPIALAVLRKSIEAHGQQTPILVRPHPKTDGRYQLAFGHRRLAAIKAINADKAKNASADTPPNRVLAIAFVRQLDDVQLARAQASENMDREDLSWIDKALFLKNLAGLYSSDVVYDILSLDKYAASRMRAVIDVIPAEIIKAIGSAHGVGAPRWKLLTEFFAAKPDQARKSAEAKLRDLDERHPEATSDERFLGVFNALTAASKHRSSSLPSGNGSTPELKISKSGVQVKVGKDQAAFSTWFEAEFPAIWQKYLTSTKS
jgi:ParB family chromosome partitioning protein